MAGHNPSLLTVTLALSAFAGAVWAAVEGALILITDLSVPLV